MRITATVTARRSRRTGTSLRLVATTHAREHEQSRRRWAHGDVRSPLSTTRRSPDEAAVKQPETPKRVHVVNDLARTAKVRAPRGGDT